jgi:hypothetical protein
LVISVAFFVRQGQKRKITGFLCRD